MHIKRIEIYGFKSFPYRTVIPLERGITAIVGPNGSGKSNILDAIKWALGEQSPKRLRVRELGDLIFSGNSDKKIDFAEVKLVLAHNPPLLDRFKDHEEIVVIRRFYKDGESEFFINNRQCRLRDIQLLFMNLGINSNSYGIIDQGEINKFLEINPIERRYYLEELAGISSLRISKEEIIKKLSSTKQNLERLKDILKEVEYQYSVLKEQADVAKEYLKLKEIYIEKKRIFLTLKLKNLGAIKEKKEKEKNFLNDELKKLETELIMIEEEEVKLLNAISILEKKKKDLIEEKKELEKKEALLIEEINSLEEKKKKLDENLEKNKFIIEFNEKKKKELENDIGKMTEELLNLKNIEKKLNEKLELINENLTKIDIEYKSLNNIFNTKKREWEEINKIIIKKREKKEYLLRDRKKTEEELVNLKKRIVELKEILKKVNDDITINKDLEKKLINQIEKKKEELKEKVKEINTIIFKETEIKNKQNDLKNKIYIFKENANMIEKILKNFEDKLPKEIEINTLGNYFIKNGEDIKLLELFFQDFLNAIIIENIKEIENFSKKFKANIFILKDNLKFLNYNIRKIELTLEEFIEKSFENLTDLILTRDRILITPNKFFIKVNNNKKGFYSLRKELIDIESQLSLLENDLIKIEEEYKKIVELLMEKKTEQHKLEKEIQDLINKREGIIKNLIYLEHKSESFNQQIIEISKKIDEFNKNINNINKLLSDLDLEMSVHEEKLKDLNRQLKELKEKIKDLELFKRKIENDKTNIEKDIIGLKNNILHISNREKEIKNELEKIENINREKRLIIERVELERKYIQEKKDKKIYEINSLKEKLISLNNEIDLIEHSINSKKENLLALTSNKREKEKKIKIIEKNLHNLNIEYTETKLFLDNIKKEIRDLNIDQFVEYKSKNFENIDINAIEKELFQLEEELKKFKEVNLSSIKEFEKIKERYDNLKFQKEDIERSISEFEKLISELDLEAKKRLLQTLETVNKHLSEIFPLLFDSAKANLSFTSDDPLRAGLEFSIYIPNKNIKNLYMLSGGEKALCVIAILLAFYLTNPGPFCILDEIDAPLDEKNALKFIKLISNIKEKSQVILISHNPHVIKEVDHIIGVTMEEKGVSKILKIQIKSE